MDFELHVVRGRSANQALKLIDGVNTVGRQDDCHVRIKSSQVSRKHCELFEKQGQLLVKDLGSANGTFVNGKKVNGQQVLQPGDELEIGGIKLKVAKAGQPFAAAPAPAPKAGDTAVVEAISATPGGADDVEFEIDFDDEPVPAPGAGSDDDVIELALAEDEPAAPAPPPAAKPAPAKSTPEPAKPPAAAKPEPAPAPAPEFADEAIADFLLDIKVDEDD